MTRRCLHMTAPRTKVAGENTRILTLQGPSRGLDPMLRPQGGGSHVPSADTPPCKVTLAGLSVTSITGTHWLHPQGASRKRPWFCQRFLHKYGLAQVGLGRCNRHQPHRFSFDLTYHSYGSRTPSALSTVASPHFLDAQPPLCAEHVQQLGSESLLSDLMEVKD